MTAPLSLDLSAPNPLLVSLLAASAPAPEPDAAAPLTSAPAAVPLPTTLAAAGGGTPFFRGQQFQRSFPRFATGARVQPRTLLGGRLVDATFPRNDLLNMLLLLRFGDR